MILVSRRALEWLYSLVRHSVTNGQCFFFKENLKTTYCISGDLSILVQREIGGVGNISQSDFPLYRGHLLGLRLVCNKTSRTMAAAAKIPKSDFNLTLPTHSTLCFDYDFVPELQQKCPSQPRRPFQALPW